MSVAAVATIAAAAACGGRGVLLLLLLLLLLLVVWLLLLPERQTPLQCSVLPRRCLAQRRVEEALLRLWFRSLGCGSGRERSGGKGGAGSGKGRKPRAPLSKRALEGELAVA